MKKMIMMAVAALVAVSAGAQNKDFLKQMKGAKAYQEFTKEFLARDKARKKEKK